MLYLTVTVLGNAVPFSLDAFFQLYFGEQRILAMILVVLSVLDLSWYHMSLVPESLPDPKKHMMLLVFPEMIAVFGFLLGFLTHNTWASLPFFAVGFGHYVYAYMKISQQTIRA